MKLVLGISEMPSMSTTCQTLVHMLSTDYALTTALGL